MLECHYCSNDEESDYPPYFAVYNLKTKDIEFVVCAQCMTNIGIALFNEQQRIRNPIIFDDEIPY